MRSILNNPFVRIALFLGLVGGYLLTMCDVSSLSAVFTSLTHPMTISGVAMAMPVVVAPFPVNPELTSVAVAYENEDLVADEVFPRIPPIAVSNFKFRKYQLADGFTIPNTHVGRKSEPSQVDFGWEEIDSSTKDYGLDEIVPNEDLLNAPPGTNLLARATVNCTDLVLLDREKRCADLAFAAGNYGSNTATLSGTSQFSDYTNSDPLAYLLEILDGMVMRPNVITFGQPVWTKFKQHPKVVSKCLGSASTSGMVTKEMVIEALEIKKVIVGKAWYNSAKKGETPSMSRLWGKHIAMHYQDPLATNDSRITFGFTVQTGSRISGDMPEPKMGLRGSVRVRAGESVREVISATDLGYFIQNAVA